MISIPERIAQEMGVHTRQVQAAIDLLDEGATVPFIARYRKELTGSLDDTQLRELEERLRYLRELEERRSVILKSIDEQDKLTAELESQIHCAETKTRLEDLYLPFKPKRRTKAQIAREAGLEPLADTLLADASQIPEQVALRYVKPDQGMVDIKAALDGARQILMERFAEDAELLGELRASLWEHGFLVAKSNSQTPAQDSKFADYFNYAERLRNIPSHRALALFRGRNEGALQLKLSLAPANAEPPEPGPCEARICARFGIQQRGRAADRWLQDTVHWAWRVKIHTRLELELMNRQREAAEAEAIRVFAANLKDLLLAPPAGPRPTLGLDPGLRTGVKFAVVDATGKVLETGTIYPHTPQKRWKEALARLAQSAQAYGIELIGIGNGTASRETDHLVGELIQLHPNLKLTKVIVSEAGASVYSASEYASQELPELDVSLRGAVSIARRLQDPLAELVKIEPKSIGVGQYQHDVNQSELARSLDAVVEDCVNRVGVDLNTASVALLSRVSGLSQGLAQNIVAFRNEHGALSNREELKRVPRLGPKTFEQAAGFLRVLNSDNPLDSSAVHPEAYPLVERIAAAHQRTVRSLIGDTTFLRRLDPRDYADERFGVPTITDLLAELEKPGRDPRPEFRTAMFKEGIESINDLETGMMLEGVVTNVTNFGAFVDIGVHQDGLVHVSALADRFIKNPREVVKAGDIVRVKVVTLDLPRKRIGLSMRLSDRPDPLASGQPKQEPSVSGSRARDQKKPAQARQKQPAGAGGIMAQAFTRARKSR